MLFAFFSGSTMQDILFNIPVFNLLFDFGLNHQNIQKYFFDWNSFCDRLISFCF